MSETEQSFSPDMEEISSEAEATKEEKPVEENWVSRLKRFIERASERATRAVGEGRGGKWN